MSSSPKGSESLKTQHSATSESGSSEKDNSSDVTSEETAKVVQMESDAKCSDVQGNAEVKKESHVEDAGDDASNEDSESEKVTPDVKPEATSEETAKQKEESHVEVAGDDASNEDSESEKVTPDVKTEATSEETAKQKEESPPKGARDNASTEDSESEKVTPDVKTEATSEETEKQKSSEKEVQTELEAKCSNVEGKAEVMNGSSVEGAGDDATTEDAKSEEAALDVKKNSKLEGEQKGGNSEEIIQGEETRGEVLTASLAQSDPVASLETKAMSSRIESTPEGKGESSEVCQKPDAYSGEDPLKYHSSDPSYTGLSVKSTGEMPKSKDEKVSYTTSSTAKRFSTLKVDYGIFSPGIGKPKEQCTTVHEDREQLIYTVNDVSDLQSQIMKSVQSEIYKEAEDFLYRDKSGKGVLNVYAPHFTAQRIEPNVKVERNAFKISVNVSLFDKETIACRVVKNTIDVYAMQERQNDYGFMMHEIHQTFKVPPLVCKDKFIAYITNDLLCIEAPIQVPEQVDETMLEDLSSYPC